MNIILTSEEDLQYLVEPFFKSIPDILYPCLAVGHWETDYSGAEGFVYHYIPLLKKTVNGNYLLDPNFLDAYE